MSLYPRNPHPQRHAPMFEGLSPQQKQEAERLLDKFLARHSDCPAWLHPILVGNARRLALNPPSSAWGRSMRAKKGGYATQRRYRIEGRTGPRHPAHYAATVSASQRKWRRQQREDAEQRKRLGLSPAARVKWLSLG
jgi:hypothetical protein